MLSVYVTNLYLAERTVHRVVLPRSVPVKREIFISIKLLWHVQSFTEHVTFGGPAGEEWFTSYTVVKIQIFFNSQYSSLAGL
jgi:hypothetical protein